MNYDIDYTQGEDQELDSLYAAITGRRAFRYDAASDPLYRSAADRYIQNGRMAMRDTMGRAAALTGGYGSSYAQAVGQQQYDEYLRALSEALPQYYSMAWQRYEAEGQALRDAYDLTRQRRQDEYERERAAAADAAAAEARDYSRQQNSYKQLYQLISSSGYVPTDQELSAAGMTRAQADALLRQYYQSRSGRSSGRGSSGRQNGSGSGGQGGGEEDQPRSRGSGGSGGGKLPSQHLN